jgi:hypothetical protein
MIKTLSFIATVTALAFSAVSPALAETLTHEGVTYVYDVSKRGETTIITGKELNSGHSFKLQVANGRVNGRFGNNLVSFSTRDVVRITPKPSSTAIAAR